MSTDSSAPDISSRLSILHGAYRHAARDEPLANHVQTISDEITRMLDRGDIGFDDLADAVDSLTRDAFRIRAGRLGTYLGEVAPDANAAGLRKLFEKLGDYIE